MNVLITGGCGFIGSHVAERFYAEGHKITLIDNLSTGSKSNVNVPHKFYRRNVADKRCEEIFQRESFDIVVHLAAQVDVATSNSNVYLDSESNILGLLNMLDLARKYGIHKFIFASSAAVYGNAQAILPIHEEMSSHPQSVYGINKSIGEYYCRQWRELFGLQTTCLRFANVYGPRQGARSEAGVISIFMKRIAENSPIVIYGDGTQTRDYIYVEDVAEAVYQAAIQTLNHSIMNISTNQEHSLAELVQILGQFGHIYSIHYEESRDGDIYRSVLENARAMAELQWQPMYSLQEGLEKTYQWYQSSDALRRTAIHVMTGNLPAMAVSS